MEEQELIKFGGTDKDLLERFMCEFFPFDELLKVGFFTKEMKWQYYLQAKRVCEWLGLNSIYEYRKETTFCHISHCGDRPENDKQFITTIPSIYL